MARKLRTVFSPRSGCAGRRTGFGDVGDQPSRRQIGDQRRGLDHLVPLARGQPDAQRVAECVGRHVKLGGKAAARAPDRLSLSPPLAPALCW